MVPSGTLDGSDEPGALAGAVLLRPVWLLSVVGAKGLEFDVTILVEPMEILQGGPGDLFVGMTRSTQRLHSVRTTALPDAWTKALAQTGKRTIEG